MSDSSAHLTALLPDGQTGVWRLDQDSFTIGREAPADLILPLARLSRQHARLTQVQRVYQLIDLNSRNGTFVNGQPLSADQPHRLKDGDEIVLAGLITFTFHDSGETVDGPRLGRLRGLWVDETAREVWVDARKVNPPLSAAQLTLLNLLYQAPGQVITRAHIIAAVWPEVVDPAGVSEEAVDGLIKRLRARLRETQPEHDYIEVLRGHGLRLTTPAE